METHDLRLADITLDKENPRQHDRERGLDDLAANIKAKGVLQPILVRPHKNGGKQPYQLVYGERRYRASKLAGLETIPAIVREMTDAEALEARIIENLQRNDVHFLDEAAGFQRLLDTGLTPQEVSDRVGKPPVYIHTRLALNNLIPEFHKPAYEGLLTVGPAMLLARHTPGIQKRFFQDVKPRLKWGISSTAVQEFVDRQAFVPLTEAPFDTADANLVPKAGACLNCPKRTGASPLLFPDIKAKDTCSDPDCFQSKCLAVIEARKKEFPKAIQIAAERAGYGKADLKDVYYLDPGWNDGGKHAYWQRSNPGDCDSTQDAIIVVGPPRELGKHTYACVDAKCPVHFIGRRSGPPLPHKPGVISEEKKQQVEELWQRRTGKACRLALHAAIRERQEQLAAKSKENTVVPLEALRAAVRKACASLHPSQDGAEYLASLWFSEKERQKGSGYHGERLLPLIDKADQHTCLRLLLDFAIAEEVSSKYSRAHGLEVIPAAYKLDAKAVVAPVEKAWNEKKAASYKKRDERLKKERAKAEAKKAKKEKKKKPSPWVEVPPVEKPEQAKHVHALHTGNCCKFCGCTEAAACVTDQGPCSWLVKPRKLRGKKEYRAGVCSNPKCVLALDQEKKEAKRAAKT
jgi:ParB family chromosome partitioning protein